MYTSEWVWGKPRIKVVCISAVGQHKGCHCPPVAITDFTEQEQNQVQEQEHGHLEDYGQEQGKEQPMKEVGQAGAEGRGQAGRRGTKKADNQVSQHILIKWGFMLMLTETYRN